MQVAKAVVLLLAGFASAVATVAVHQYWWGLLLGLVGSGLALHAVGPGWATRLSFGVGWAGLVAVVAPTRAEGDFVLSASPASYAVIGAAVVVLVWSVGTLPRPRGGVS